MQIDRRAMLKGGVAASLVASSWAIPALARPDARGIAVFDARLEPSRLFAAGLAARGMATLDPRSRDLGPAWHDELPQVLRSGGTIEGLTMWSDRFVCESFAAQCGHKLRVVSTLGGRDHTLYHWIIV